MNHRQRTYDITTKTSARSIASGQSIFIRSLLDADQDANRGKIVVRVVHTLARAAQIAHSRADAEGDHPVRLDACIRRVGAGVPRFSDGVCLAVG